MCPGIYLEHLIRARGLFTPRLPGRGREAARRDRRSEDDAGRRPVGPQEGHSGKNFAARQQGSIECRHPLSPELERYTLVVRSLVSGTRLASFASQSRVPTQPSSCQAEAAPRLPHCQAGLSESRRIARQRLAIRDSVKISASAIRRFGDSVIPRIRGCQSDLAGPGRAQRQSYAHARIHWKTDSWRAVT